MIPSGCVLSVLATVFHIFESTRRWLEKFHLLDGIVVGSGEEICIGAMVLRCPVSMSTQVLKKFRLVSWAMRRGKLCRSELSTTVLVGEVRSFFLDSL